MRFQYTNSTSPPPSTPTSNFTITAPPPQTSGASPPPTTPSPPPPILHRTLTLTHFHRIRVTVSAPWKTLYDQGGLLFARPRADGEKKWVKAGIEFFDGRACATVVAKDNWADWSSVEVGSDTVTVEFAREAIPETDQPSLWVYLVEDGGRRRPIREITWAFEGGPGWCLCCEADAYAGGSE
ncbi:hypothetical protein HO173_006633 [Letharia columbiana]|uniref:Uncharacterized protein n=1 Tax=Letharia columbiana TaxID=112416 RepID=A0A8H6FVB6_9LECA|nr:uncharacterized protein HO173_006633 [Letharia columbiana]KAF6235437.1 hypothetical protein HO173_006633 [Letharia columbiana]